MGLTVDLTKRGEVYLGPIKTKEDRPYKTKVRTARLGVKKGVGYFG